jgi:hypothetical protein
VQEKAFPDATKDRQKNPGLQVDAKSVEQIENFLCRVFSGCAAGEILQETS